MSTKPRTVQLNHVAVERSDDGLVTLQIEVAHGTVQAMREKVIKEYSRRLRVAGFRPGHIPPNIVRRNVGDENIAQQVSDELVPIAYQQALEQESLQPLERAQVDQLTFDAFSGDEPLNFTARVIVRPAIALGETKGLTLEQPAITVTDEDIEQGLEALRAERATLRNVDERGAQEGDILSAELQVYLGDQPHTPEPTRIRAFVLGDSGFVPRIDEHLIGAHLDEERRFNVTYPSDFQDQELAGQAAEFAVKVTSVKERVLPEANDELAQAMGVDDMAALRERMQLFILSSREREARDGLRGQLVEAVVANATLEVPASLINNRVHRRIHNLEHELEHRETTMEQYLTQASQTQEEFEAQVRTEIEAELRRELVLDEVAQRENLAVSNDEIEDYYLRMAEALGQPVEQLVEQVDINGVRASILQRKAVDWLYENAAITGGADAAAASAVAAPSPVAAPNAVSEASETSDAESGGTVAAGAVAVGVPDEPVTATTS